MLLSCISCFLLIFLILFPSSLPLFLLPLHLDIVLLFSPGWSRTLDPSASVFHVLGFLVCCSSWLTVNRLAAHFLQRFLLQRMPFQSHSFICISPTRDRKMWQRSTLRDSILWSAWGIQFSLPPLSPLPPSRAERPCRSWLDPKKRAPPAGGCMSLILTRIESLGAQVVVKVSWMDCGQQPSCRAEP